MSDLVPHDLAPFDPADPRWTAYVLGELDLAEQKRCENLLARDPEARDHVLGLREAADALRAEFAAELDATPRATSIAAASPTLVVSRSRSRRGAMLLAAMAAVLLLSAALWMYTRQDAQPAPENSLRREAEAQAIRRADPRAAPTMLPFALDPSSTMSAPASNHESYEMIVEEAEVSNDSLAALGYVTASDEFLLGLASRAARITLPQEDIQEARSTGESYDRVQENRFADVTRDSLSTFSIDVDTASYANVRRFLEQGQNPPPDAVRIEELINAFDYDDPAPQGAAPFTVNLEMARCPWKSEHRLVRIGIQGKEIPRAERPAVNLVFLIDVSGSMSAPNKLDLVKRSLALLAEELEDKDRVAMVVYAGSSGLVLPSTSCSDRTAIFAAIERLESGGSTNGGAGIELAYATAREHFIAGGANRVILCTDGDFNVGITDRQQLIDLVRERAGNGIFLTVLGFGMGNLKDATLEQLADQGNGFYGYVDSMREAEKLFVRELSGTLITIAKDVKIQLEFNPAQVQSFRLLGYENRMLAHQDFADDKKDAGEIGAGHDVTALYEIALRDEPRSETATTSETPSFLLRYQDTPEIRTRTEYQDEIVHVRLRYKEPEGTESRLIEQPLVRSDKSFDEASENLRFASAVALFGMLLRGSEHAGSGTYATVLELASTALSKDPNGERAAFLELVRRKR